MILVTPPSSRIGKDIVPRLCLGRSATRTNSQVLPSKRNTPGLRRHAISNPSKLGLRSPGDRIGLAGKRLTMSFVIRSFLKSRGAARRSWMPVGDRQGDEGVGGSI